MKRNKAHLIVVCVASLLVAFGAAQAGCSGDSETTPPGGATSATVGSGVGGTGGTGGASSASGGMSTVSTTSTGGASSSTSGSGGSGGIMCPYTGPDLVDPSIFPACTPACDGAHCVPAALVPPEFQAQFAPCNDGSGYCTPDFFIATEGNGVPKTCTSVAGSEGRCLSTCLPAIAAEASLLPQDVCGTNEVCVPCYDPTAADPTAPTGACSIACDAPTKPPTMITCPYSGPAVIDPSTFSDCSPACAGAHCVQANLIPTDLQSQLAACATPSGAGFCAPDSIVETAGEGVPKTCTSVAGAEGRCLSTCLPEIAAEAFLLPTDVCTAGQEVCVPCYDPTAADPTAPTGACSTACDAPTQPPVTLTCPWTGPAVIDPNTLAQCSPACGGAHCLPASLVPADVASELAACTTPEGAGYCAPDPLISAGGNYVPPTCDPFPGSGAEGRCLSDCLPAIAANADLVQSSCAAGDSCAPCSDPFTGAATGACTLSCDNPQQPPFTFPTCCVYNGTPEGTCVPQSLLPSGSTSNLIEGSCPSGSASYLCVPNEYLPGSTATIPTCQTILGVGACVSDCVDLGLIGILLTRGSCPGNHVCVPCAVAPGTPGCP